jgi:hypothetical protein
MVAFKLQDSTWLIAKTDGFINRTHFKLYCSLKLIQNIGFRGLQFLGQDFSCEAMTVRSVQRQRCMSARSNRVGQTGIRLNLKFTSAANRPLSLAAGHLT